MPAWSGLGGAAATGAAVGGPPGALIGLGIRALGGLFGGIGRAKAEKRKARSEQKAMQWKVNQKQKGLNRGSSNFAGLLRALKREGWFGDDPSSPDSFMNTAGRFNAADWRYDPVPLAETPGVWGSALAGAGSGIQDWFTDETAAAREAEARASGG